jgi:hypothetical protein
VESTRVAQDHQARKLGELCQGVHRDQADNQPFKYTKYGPSPSVHVEQSKITAYPDGIACRSYQASTVSPSV